MRSCETLQPCEPSEAWPHVYHVDGGFRPSGPIWQMLRLLLGASHPKCTAISFTMLDTQGTAQTVQGNPAVDAASHAFCARPPWAGQVTARGTCWLCLELPASSACMRCVCTGALGVCLPGVSAEALYPSQCPLTTPSMIHQLDVSLLHSDRGFQCFRTTDHTASPTCASQPCCSMHRANVQQLHNTWFPTPLGSAVESGAQCV
jgi:hypothetical protein